MGLLNESELLILESRLSSGGSFVPTEDELQETWSGIPNSTDPGFFLMSCIRYYNDAGTGKCDNFYLDMIVNDSLDLGISEPSLNPFKANKYNDKSENTLRFERSNWVRKSFDGPSARVMIRFLFLIRHFALDRQDVRRAIHHWVLAIRGDSWV